MRRPPRRANCTRLALALCAVVVCGGCASGFPAMEPYCTTPGVSLPAPVVAAPPASVPPPSPLAAGPALGGYHRAVELSPAEAIAPVGTDVVMLAGVCGQDGYLHARQRIEWMIDQAGVGQFVEVGRRASLDWLLAADTWPRKIDNTFAIGLTSSATFTITRGTAATSDDVPVLRGQAWASITSAVEGVTHVTAVAPDVFGWGARQQTAVIHWVDAQWSFPAPAINPVGARHMFTTSVSRHTDQSPVAGWLVRYEILDGPAAGFAPDGAQIVEVPTDVTGQASAEIYQREPAGGVNNVSVQIVRPAPPATLGGRALVIASGATTATWSAPQIALVMSGPATAAIGATATYQIQVSNPGDLAATGITVTSEVPQGTTFVASSPSVQPASGRLQWSIDSLGAGQVAAIEIDLRGDTAGALEVCASVTTAEGLTASDCATTNFTAAALDVAMIGPGQATVGQNVTFEVTVTNHGDVLATDLVAVSRYDEGLRHAVAASPLERTLENLEPGQSITFAITFAVEREGELCNAIEIFSASELKAQTRECVTATAAPPTQPPAQPPPTTPPVQTGAASTMSVTVSGPDRRSQGDSALVSVVVSNTGQTVLADVKVVANFDAALEPSQATAGYEWVGGDLTWRLASLAAGAAVRYEIDFRCAATAARACTRLTVNSAEGARDDAEHCLAIDAVAADLEVLVSDLSDPLAVDKRTAYDVSVTNRSSVSDRDVALVVTVPDQLRPLEVGTVGPAAHSISGQRVIFQPVAELRGGETVNFRVAAQSVAAGDATLSAEVTSQRATRPVTASETTKIFVEP